VLAHQGLTRLSKDEELELEGDLGSEPERLEAREDVSQQTPRARRMPLPARIQKIRQERRHAGLPGDAPLRRRIDPRVRVGIPRVPPGDLRAIVQDVAHVPAEDHVTEAKALRQRGLELLEGDVLSPEHAVDVEAPDLGATDPLAPQPPNDVARRAARAGARARSGGSPPRALLRCPSRRLTSTCSPAAHRPASRASLRERPPKLLG